MLDRLRIESTRGRSRHSNDNGMAQTKNGAVVRKVFDDARIQTRHVARFATFQRESLKPFPNLHRPGLSATELAHTEKPQSIKRGHWPHDAMKPPGTLASLAEAASLLRHGVTLLNLRQMGRALTDVQAAEELNEACQALFRRVPARTYSPRP